MLTCVYNPIEPVRVVEADEADRLKASGIWFDSPAKAQKYRERVEHKIGQESKVEKPKDKQKGKSNER